MPDSIHVRVLFAKRFERSIQIGCAETGQVPRRQEVVLTVEQTELERTRAGIDDKRIHLTTLPDRTGGAFVPGPSQVRGC
jgi:hypothetical protein